MLMVVVEEKSRAAPQNNWKPETNSQLLGSGPKLPAAPASPNTTTTPAPRCPECGSQKTWKDGIRYTPYGEAQRYLCRNCSYRFSRSDPSEPSEHHQKIHTLILKSEMDKPSTRNRHGDLRYPPHGALKSTTVPGPKIRRVACNQHEAVKAMESRTQEQAAGATTLNQAEIKGKIVEFMWKLKRDGYSEATITCYAYILGKLVKDGANLQDPDSVKDTIALRETWGLGRKNNAAKAYTLFLKLQGLTWQKPKYKPTFKLPFIPIENEIDDLIAGCGSQMATFLQVLKETAMRSGEAFQLRWTDIDTMNNTIRIMPEKGSNPRIFRISSKLACMLGNQPKTTDKIFTYKDKFYLGKAFRKQRRRIAHKFGNPRILQIHFHTLRHWKATMEYARTKDILYVMQLLGHRKIENTLKYTQLVNFKNDEYVCKVARTIDEDKELLEAAFEYITERDGIKIYRKRK